MIIVHIYISSSRGKVRDKIRLIHHLLDIVDEIIPAGLMLYTFLKALQREVSG